MHVCVHVYICQSSLLEAEDKLQESVLPFGHVGPRGQILVISLDSSLSHLLSYLYGPLLCVHVCMRVQRWVEVCVCVCMQEHSQVSSRACSGPKSTLSVPQSPSTLLIETSLSKNTNTKPSEFIDAATLAGQLPPEIPHLPLQSTALHECQRSKSSPHSQSHLCCPCFVHMWMSAGIVFASVHTHMYSMEPEVNLRQWFLAIIHLVFWDKVSHISGTYQQDRRQTQWGVVVTSPAIKQVDLDWEA